MTLDDFRPTSIETIETGGMPEQVAIGYIRAKRRHDLHKAKDLVDSE